MADGRKIAIGVGVGCLVLLLSSLCCGGLAYYGFDQMFQGPRRMANGFFLDLREGRPDAARARMGAAYQASHDLGAFQQAVTQVPALTQHTEVRWSNINVQNQAAVLGGELATTAGAIPVEVKLSHASNGHWYIDEVTVQGAPMP